MFQFLRKSGLSSFFQISGSPPSLGLAIVFGLTAWRLGRACEETAHNRACSSLIPRTLVHDADIDPPDWQ
jgi:hypothetical protein